MGDRTRRYRSLWLPLRMLLPIFGAAGIGVALILYIHWMLMSNGSTASTELLGVISKASSSNSTLPKLKVSHYSKLTILLGELPGYTGWARPFPTLAHQFSILRVSSPVAHTGANWTITVACSHSKGLSGGALFFVRAYGRSLLTGTVTDHQDGMYDISFAFFDVGVYQVEVVLTFSNPPPMTSFPLQDEPLYEGFLLPGFPLELRVLEGKSFYPSQRLCSLSELLETSPASATETGRWLVTQKVAEQQYSDGQGISVQGYEDGMNSLGFQMEYFPLNCSLISTEKVRDLQLFASATKESPYSSKPFHIVFIGDSNMARQSLTFDYFGKNVKVTYLRSNGGLVNMLGTIKKALKDLARKDHNYFVLFNSGMHDVFELCTASKFREHMESFNVSAEEFSCTKCYRELIEDFADAIQQFPALIRVWQTTMAAWPRWGNYGAGWTINRKQSLPEATHMAEYLNEIAWDIMQRKNISILDSYWLSLSRPDNRQISMNSDLGKKLAHAGQEVYSVLMRKWAMIILEVIKGRVQ